MLDSKEDKKKAIMGVNGTSAQLPAVRTEPVEAPDEAQGEQDKSEIPKESWAPENFSCRVLLAYFVKSGLLDEESGCYKIGKRLLSTERLSFGERLRAIFMEVRGDQHSGAIPLLKKNVLVHLSVESIQNAIDSLNYLENLIQGLEDGTKHNAAALNSWKESSEEAKKSLGSLYKLYNSATDEQNSKARKDVENRLIEYLDKIKVLMGSYFHIIPSDYSSTPKSITDKLYKTLKDKITEYTDEKRNDEEFKEKLACLQFSSSDGIGSSIGDREIWIPQSDDIYRMLSDITLNIKHANEKIANHWDRFKKEKAYMLIHFSHYNEGLEIKFENASNLTAQDLENKLEPKKYRRKPISQFGGYVDVETKPPEGKKPGVVVLRVRIPYIEYFNEEKVK